jgi:hypothetical protein
MATIFYLMTFIFIGYELWVLTHTDFLSNLSYHNKQFIKDKIITAELMHGCVVFVFSIFYTIWCIIGLFSVNAKFFLILLLVGIIGGILRRLYKNQSQVIIGIDSFICIVTLCVIFINHFI